MHTILVPVDGSDHSLKALHIACDLADKYGGRVVLLHVLSQGRRAKVILELAAASTYGPALTTSLQEFAAHSPGPAPNDLLEAVGQKILDQAKAKIERRDIEFESLPIAVGDPADSILIAHKQTKATTIVMGSRGAASDDSPSFGSVSNKVFAEADCTCLSVK